MKNIGLIIGCVFIITHSYSQEYVRLMEDKNANFFEIQEAFYNYWENKPYEKGKGWKQFKRWEYFMEPRVNAQGVIPDPGKTWEEFQKFQKKYASTKADKSNKTSNWSPLGPTSWNSIGWNPGIGRINTVAVDPNNSNVIYVGAPAGGCWKSTNAGSSWIPLTDTLASLGVSGIAIDPSNSNVIYLATGDGDGSDTYSIGVIKSIDGGNTWQSTGLIWTTSQSRIMRKIIINPTNPNILFVATSNGLWKTSNAGASWTSVRGGNFRDIEFNPLNPNTIYASTNSNVFKSVAGGALNTFSTLLNGLPATGVVGRFSIAVTEDDTNYVYALATDPNDNGFLGLYRSTDAGNTFTLRANTPNIMGWNTTGSDAGGQGWYDLALAVSPTNKDLLFTGGGNVWKSTNGGSTFTANTRWNWPTGSFGYVHADIHTLDYFGNTLFCGSDGGIFKTTNDGSSWSDITFGIQNSQFYRLGTDPNNAGNIMAGAQDNGCLLLKSGSWTHVTGGDGMECLIDYSDNNFMYSTSQNGTIYRSTNGGGSFNQITGSISETGAWVTPYVIDPNNPAILYAGYTNLYKTTNRGNSWTQISNFSATGTIRSLAVAPSNSNTIYIATQTTIRKTTNGGTSWSVINNGLPNNSITYISVHNLNPNILWVSLSGFVNGQKVYKSIDGGATWINESGNLPNLPINCVLYENGTNNGIYVGTDLGIYYKNDNLLNWVSFMDNLPNVQVNELEIHYATGKIRAATFGRGIWESAVFPVNTPPIADFSSPDTVICPGVCAKFTNLTTNLGQQWMWYFPGGTPATSTDLNPTVCYPNLGNYDVSLVVSNVNGVDSLFRAGYIQVTQPTPGINLPIVEGFENGTATPTGWAINNPDNSGTWSHNNTIGAYGTSSSSVFIDNRTFDFTGQIDELKLPKIDFTSVATPQQLTFDVAHARFGGTKNDTLSIYYTNDCGATKTLLWQKDGNALATRSFFPLFFVPTSTEWRNETVDLSALSGLASVELFFENKSGNGNNIYLDNINILDSGTVGIKETLLELITVFPNPANNTLTISGLPTTSALTTTITDLAGKTIFIATTNPSNQQQIDISKLANGIYLLQLTMNTSTKTLKFVKQ
ncbi:MAG: hypothetical protein CVT95_07060 [Bacteroidetes bacterium HGW-Bacteroidetes-12]|nr:MAG: hypothetical protein CVT95_07060 [Bacteroidetes bacterium HGW-Bacteroidetes-12]